MKSHRIPEAGASTRSLSTDFDVKEGE